MKGSITKYTVKGSSRPKWRYRIRLGKDESGNRLREGRGGFAKEGEAREAMDKRIQEIKERPPEITLGQWVEKWIETYAVQRCQPKTLERYRQLAQYVISAESPIAPVSATPLSALTHREIEPALYALLEAKGKRREHISARTVRQVAGLVNVALNKAFRLELIQVNPMLRVELPPFEKRDARSLTREQIMKLRDICRGDWTFAFVEVALATAARRGELLAVGWPDIDWAGKVISITKSLEQTAAGIRVKTTKSKKHRHFILPKTATAALQFQRDQQAEHKRLGADYHDNQLIFCQPNGDYLLPDLVSQIIIRRIQKAGIKDASLHTLQFTRFGPSIPWRALIAGLRTARPCRSKRYVEDLQPYAAGGRSARGGRVGRPYQRTDPVIQSFSCAGGTWQGYLRLTTLVE